MTNEYLMEISSTIEAELSGAFSRIGPSIGVERTVMFRRIHPALFYTQEQLNTLTGNTCR